MNMDKGNPELLPANQFRSGLIRLASKTFNLEVSIWCSDEFSEILHQVTDEDFEGIIQSWDAPKNTNRRAIHMPANVIKEYTKLAKLKAEEINVIYQQKLRKLLDKISDTRLNRRFNEVVNIHDQQASHEGMLASNNKYDRNYSSCYIDQSKDWSARKELHSSGRQSMLMRHFSVERKASVSLAKRREP